MGDNEALRQFMSGQRDGRNMYLKDTNIEQVRNQLKDIAQQSEQRVRNDLSRQLGPDRLDTLLAVSSQKRVPLMLLSPSELEEAIPNRLVFNDPFQNRISDVFVWYRDQLLSNDVKRVRHKKGPKKHLSEAEFRKRYGPAPWSTVNTILKSCGADFSVDHPEPSPDGLFDQEPYIARLKKNSSQDYVDFSALSSGERVMISVAICIYNQGLDANLLRKPKLLLFDEIDAPLHPSMSKQFVDAVKTTLVEKLGIKVILTTHSPATVAVCSEEEVFVMRPGESGLHKTSKQGALNTLMSGLPILALSFDGRRQVFAESQKDAELLDKLFQTAKSRLQSNGRLLTFIGVGGKQRSGKDVNSGCDHVKRIVVELSKNGNVSTFGLVDWDRCNKSEGRVHVLCEGERHSIENCVLDPLAVVALVRRENLGEKAGIRFRSNETYGSFSSIGKARLQNIVDELQDLVLGAPASKEIKDTVSYSGGLSLQIRRQYLRMQGHDLEELILEKIPYLQSVREKQQIALKERMVESVFPDHPDIIPSAVLTTFSNLLDADI